MMKIVKPAAMLLFCLFLLAACSFSFENGNLKIRDDNADIVSIGRDGFTLDGNLTGIKLDGNGLRIEYPNGSLIWGDEGFDIKHDAGSLRIADGSMVITDKDGKQKVLDTTGDGAEYSTEGGVLVGTGKKAVLPEDYPAGDLPLMDGFVLNASALLGSVQVISGYVPGKAVEDVTEYYQEMMSASNSYSQELAEGRVVLRAKLDGREVTVYLFQSVTQNAVNISIIIGA